MPGFLLFDLIRDLIIIGKHFCLICRECLAVAFRQKPKYLLEQFLIAGIAGLEIVVVEFNGHIIGFFIIIFKQCGQKVSGQNFF